MKAFSRAGRYVALCALLLGVACESPTRPDGRTGIVELVEPIRCEESGQSPLRCRAMAVCKGFYPCGDIRATGTDVTERAEWRATATIARVAGLGSFEAVGIGYGIVEARHPGTAPANGTIAVFAGTPPLPTFQLVGNIFERGGSAATTGIVGATIEILDGLVAGRAALTGMQSGEIPGFNNMPSAPHEYRLAGIPPGRYRVRATASGFLPLERSLIVASVFTWDDGGSGDFQLTRR